MTAPLCNAVILAAGRSTRMGQDKALLDIGGVPLWRRQCEALVAAGAREIYFSMRRDQHWAPAVFAPLYDEMADLGPIGGLEAALKRCQFPHVMVLAVDLAQVTPAWFQHLMTQCEEGRGAVGRWPNGMFEPLAAIYPKGLLGEVRAAVALREYSMQKILTRAVADKRMLAVELTEAERPLFANWNSPGDLKAG